MKLYLDSGYINMRGIIEQGLPFNLIIGGRGTGKTYGALEYVIEDAVKFMLMRRTQKQIDLISTPELYPFKTLNRDKKWNIVSKSIAKDISGFYNCTNSELKDSPLSGYCCALSTISNIRGFDGSDIKMLLYDEFIPEIHERPIKGEAEAFFNAYETINRNRELEGEKPLQVIAMSNANTIDNPLFIELGVVSKAAKMKKDGKEFSIDRNRGLAIYVLDKSKISRKKEETALYKLTKGSEFADTNINNEFPDVDYTNVITRPLVEYTPIVAVGEICIYRHKSNRKFYVSTHKIGSPPYYSSGYNDLVRYARKYSWIWLEYLANNIEFESVLCEVVLTKYHK